MVVVGEGGEITEVLVEDEVVLEVVEVVAGAIGVVVVEEVVGTTDVVVVVEVVGAAGVVVVEEVVGAAGIIEVVGATEVVMAGMVELVVIE